MTPGSHPSRRRWLIISALLVFWIGPPSASTDEPPAADLDPTEFPPLLFNPQDRDSPDLVVTAGTRKVGSRGQSERVPYVQTVVPQPETPSIDLTFEPSPVLYWFLGDSADRAEINIITDPPIRDPIRIAITGPLAPGIHRVSLADHRVKLERHAVYIWMVRVNPDDAKFSASRDFGTVERIEPNGAEVEKHWKAQDPLERTEPLGVLLRNGDPMTRARALLAAGIWYDAFDSISLVIDSDPTNSGLRRRRAELLERVGLGKVAEYERRSSR